MTKNMIDPQNDRDARSMDNPNIPLGDPSVWSEVFGDHSTESGEAVSPHRALTYAPVWQAVNLISGDVSKLPLNVYRRRPDLGPRGREVDKQHPAQKLIRRMANPAMAAYKFWRRLMTHALIWNQAYALIDYGPGGVPVGLLPLLPDRTTPQIQDDGSIIYVSEISGTLHGFAASQVLHIEGISIFGDGDCELVYKARNSFALGLVAEKFASRFFKHGARIGGILEVPAGMSKPGADNLETGFRKTYDSVDSAFKTVILREGAKFTAGQFTPEQSQLVGARQEQIREVARWYNLPSHKLGDATNVSYSSLEQENRSYLDSTLSAWLHTIAAECYLKLLTVEQQENDTHFIEHNTGALIAADILTQYTVGRMGIEMGVLSPDEFRAMQNQNPRSDGLGDKFLKPLNMEFAGEEPLAPADPPPAPVDTEPAEDEPAEDDSAEQAAREAVGNNLAAAMLMTITTVRRWARQKTPAALVNHVDNRLAELAAAPFTSRITDSMAVLVALKGGSDDQIAEKVTRRWLEIVQKALNATFETTTAEDLPAAISARCDDLLGNETQLTILWSLINENI